MKIERVNNLFLNCIKVLFHKMKTTSDIIRTKKKNMVMLVIIPRREPITNVLLNRHSINLLLKNKYYI